MQGGPRDGVEQPYHAQRAQHARGAGEAHQAEERAVDARARERLDRLLSHGEADDEEVEEEEPEPAAAEPEKEEEKKVGLASQRFIQSS